MVWRPIPFLRLGVLPAALLASGIFLSAWRCTSNKDERDGDGKTPKPDPSIAALATAFDLDEAVAKEDLAAFTLAPHPVGSDRQLQLAQYLKERATDLGLNVHEDQFTATVPNPKATSPTQPVMLTFDKQATNVVAWQSAADEPKCTVAIASHYDSKYFEDFRYVGANDSGSSSILLLQLLGYLRANRETLATECDVMGIWFDGEEAYLPNWSDGQISHPAKIQDNTYGSRHLASRLTPCPFEGKRLLCLPEALGGTPLVALVLIDMVGSPGLSLTRDGNSTPSLIRELEAALAAAAGTVKLSKYSTPISDDHLPFLQRGVPSLNIIDFNNLDYWHRPGDEIDNISFESIELAGKAGLYVALNIARNPKVFATPAEE